MVIKAFEMANPFGFQINSDVIAGLPGENLEDFEKTLVAMIEQGADNITVHTLAVKRASALLAEDKDYHYSAKDVVDTMLEKAHKLLPVAGYHPYYLYRQKHMAGALENVGYCKEGTMCLYNVRIMDEHQSVIALGAGGISKAYYPEEDRLERIPNVSNYKIYIERINEMIERKIKNLFMEEEL
jgi:oxygen-independent coproporphyrinogen-3 oxidase